MERSKKNRLVDASVCIHHQQPRILFIGRKDGSVAEMDETQVMTAATSLELSSNKLEQVILLKKSFLMPVKRQHEDRLAL